MRKWPSGIRLISDILPPIYITYQLITGEFKAEQGQIYEVGRMGKIEVGENNVAVMGEPYVFDKSNIEQFAEIY